MMPLTNGIPFANSNELPSTMSTYAVSPFCESGQAPMAPLVLTARFGTNAPTRESMGQLIGASIPQKNEDMTNGQLMAILALR